MDLPEQGLFLDLSANRALLPMDKQIHEDYIILQEVLPDIKIMELAHLRKWHAEKWPAQDRFLTGIRDATQTNVLMTWHVFATQIFLDTIHTLRVEVARPFEEVRSVFYQSLHIRREPLGNRNFAQLPRLLYVHREFMLTE